MREIPTLTLLNGYTARLVDAERVEPARGVAAHRAVRQPAGADRRPARPDQLLRRQRRSPTTRARSSSATRWSTTRCSAWRSTARAWPREFDAEERLPTSSSGSSRATPTRPTSRIRSSRCRRSATRSRRSRCPKGTYRVWFRTDNSVADVDPQGRRHQPRSEAQSGGRPLRPLRPAQRVDSASTTTSTASVSDSRTGSSSTRRTRGASATRRWTSRRATAENLVEGYYNFLLTERLRLSFHLTARARYARRRRASSGTSSRAFACRRRSRLESSGV